MRYNFEYIFNINIALINMYMSGFISLLSLLRNEYIFFIFSFITFYIGINSYNYFYFNRNEFIKIKKEFALEKVKGRNYD